MPTVFDSCTDTPLFRSTATFDHASEPDDFDDETRVHLQKEVEKAEEDEANPYGKPGSFLNKLIMYGNKKTEDDLAREAAARNSAAAAAEAPLKENDRPL